VVIFCAMIIPSFGCGGLGRQPQLVYSSGGASAT
jgi:hypothetical protein